MQKINLDSDLLFDKRWQRKRKTLFELYKCAFLIVVIILIAYSLPYHEKPAQYKDAAATCAVACHRHVALSRFFESKGSPDPRRMATAVLETNRPRLMASIAIRESHGNPKAVGDGGRSKGAFQTQPRHWSKLMHEKKVSKDPVIQALDSERILDDLLVENNGNMKKALSAYNGERTRKVYAQNILKDLEMVP